MQRTHPRIRSLISRSLFPQRCQRIQPLLAHRQQISTKPPPDDLSNRSPLDNLHAAREEFANRRRRILIPITSIAILVSLASAIYLSNQSSTKGDKIFDPPRFTPFVIISHEDLSSTGFIVTLRPLNFVKKNGDGDVYKEEWKRGVWSLEVKQPLLQIARNYTPLPPSPLSPQQNDGELRFLIRKERGGEVSNYLAGLPVGGTLELRGPHRGVDLSINPVKEVVFLAGGTGIAPALQVIHTLLERKGDGEKPRICIFWANRRREDCMVGTNSAAGLHRGSTRSPNTVVKQLEDLKARYPRNLRVEYLVDEEGTLLDQKKISALMRNGGEVKFGPTHSRIDERLLFVSGPEGFVNYVAGPKKWDGGVETQGELGGVLGKLGIRGWKVWKL